MSQQVYGEGKRPVHLDWVPTASLSRNDSVSLGEMNSLLERQVEDPIPL